MTAGSFTVLFPTFTNNDDTLCPLTYRLSSTNDSFTEDLTLSAPTTALGEISIVVPVDVTQPTVFTFYL